MKLLKALMLVAVLAGALSLGACAHKNEGASMNTTTSSSTHGYSK